MHDRTNNPAVSAKARGDKKSRDHHLVPVDELRAMAEDLGFTVRSTALPEGLLGASAYGQIYLHPELAGAQLRSTLAHEIVHAQLGHPHAARRGIVAWRDAGAWMDGLIDALAASMLFTDDQFARTAESFAGASSAAVAAMLGVDRTMLWNWYATRSVLRATEVDA